MREREKYEGVEQLFDNEICFDWKTLTLSLEAYFGRNDMLKALDYISRVEDWRHRVDESGVILDAETDDDET